ncbi:acyl-coenzyme A thioesterase THEM4 isoform 2-T2 [Anableps anableps]
MALSVGRIFSGFRCFGSLPFWTPQLKTQCSSVLFRTTSKRTLVALPAIFSRKPRDFSLPNSSWGEEMMQLYNHYNSQSEEATEGREDRGEQWQRLPSYNRSLKYATGGVYLSKIIQSKARLFTRNIRDPGTAFEYVLFFRQDKLKCVCIFQAGHLLEGPPGHVHGGAIATMIDTVTGTHASLLSAPVMTANLNINYRRNGAERGQSPSTTPSTPTGSQDCSSEDLSSQDQDSTGTQNSSENSSPGLMFLNFSEKMDRQTTQLKLFIKSTPPPHFHVINQLMSW